MSASHVVVLSIIVLLLIVILIANSSSDSYGTLSNVYLPMVPKWKTELKPDIQVTSNIPQLPNYETLIWIKTKEDFYLFPENHVPHWKQFNKLIDKQKGKEPGQEPMNLTVLSAYEFNDVMVVTMKSANYFGKRVKCHYYDDNHEEIAFPFPSIVFPDFTVYCQHRSNTSFMALSKYEDDNTFFAVPVVDRTMQTPHDYLSICMGPIYGKEPKWLMLIDFIEHYKLQGATKFYMYAHNLNEYDMSIMQDYIRTGEVEFIMLHDRYTRRDEYWQSVEILDCNVRSRAISQWSAFVDLDERLTPVRHDETLVDYLRNLSDPLVKEISFRQRWILKNDTSPVKYESREQVAEWMPTRRYHNTSSVGPAGHTAKCIVDPNVVLGMRVHFVGSYFDDKYKSIYVDPHFGTVRHYRDIQSGEWYKRWLKEVEQMGPFMMTDYPDKLMQRLTNNVVNRAVYVYDTTENKKKDKKGG